MTARTFVPAALLTACIAGGCTYNNDRLTLGDRTPQESVALTSISPAPALAPATGPSAPTLDRGAWEPVVILSPPEHVGTDAHLTQLQPAYGSTPARRKGLHPTADSALTLDDQRLAFAEALSGLGWAGWDIIMMLPRGVAAPLRSPDEAYQRYAPPATTTDVATPSTPSAPAGGR